MLQNPLLSGWFRVQPFSKYIVFVILIAPLMAASAHSPSERSQVAKHTSIANDMETLAIDTVTAKASKANPELHVFPTNSLRETRSIVAQPESLELNKNESWTVEEDSLVMLEVPENQSLLEVEVAPPQAQSEDGRQDLSISQLNLVERIKASKYNSLPLENSYLSKSLSAAESSGTSKIVPVPSEVQPKDREVPVVEESDETQTAQQDPIGSSYPIPWSWILETHEAISSTNGSGVRYYRSVPVLSPDNRYAVYSRVQLEIKPELYNSRVSSVLFLEDRQTGKLRVMSSTSRNMDTLVNAKVPSDANGEGTIGVLVPVSWSEKGEHFLARKFEAVFNTSDASDRAVIWNRQKNHANTVSPTHDQNEHEKISILLGWSQTQPGNVLFRAGEMGEEDWPMLTVSDDGKTAIAGEADRPVTFGKKVSQVWAGPQVAYR